MRLADNDTFAVETSYLVEKYTAKLIKDDVEELGLYISLEKDCNIVMTDAIETFCAVNVVDSEMTRLLSVPKRQAAIHIERIAYSDGIIIEYCDSLIRGDKYKYTVQLHKNGN